MGIITAGDRQLLYIPIYSVQPLKIQPIGPLFGYTGDGILDVIHTNTFEGSEGLHFILHSTLRERKITWAMLIIVRKECDIITCSGTRELPNSFSVHTNLSLFDLRSIYGVEIEDLDYKCSSTNYPISPSLI